MTASFGYEDFVTKASGGADYLTTIAVNTGGVQSTVITTLVQPGHVGLMFFWVASLASAGSPIEVAVSSSLNIAGLVTGTIMADSTPTIVPFPGAFITSIPGNICTVIVTKPSGVPAPVSGSLLVLGLNAVTAVNPAERWQLRGFGAGSGSVTIPAASQGAVLAPPLDGYYYRLRATSVRKTAVSAAIQSASWAIGNTANYFLQHQLDTPAPQTFNASLDLSTDQAIYLLNNTSVNLLVSLGYEIWAK